MLTQEQHDKGLNKCDKCHLLMKSEELIWITSEDFVPKEGEILSILADRYDALCPSCYNSLLI